MRPLIWQPPVALSPQEAPIVRRIRRAKLFVLLRDHRHELFDAAFQAELATMYKERHRASRRSRRPNWRWRRSCRRTRGSRTTR